MTTIFPSDCETYQDYAVFRDVSIPMRDGIKLSASIFFPTKDGKVELDRKYPVLLNRTAYAFTSDGLGTVPAYMAHFAAERGYVFVVNSSRGTYLSEGELEPMVNEGEDGVDTVAWLMEQPWCNGQIATMGMSWLGGTQYALQLMGDVPGLETAVITCPAMNSRDSGWVYAGEFLDVSCAQSWCFLVSVDQCLFRHLPQETIDGIMEDNALLGDPFHCPHRFNMSDFYGKYSLRDIPIARRMPFYQQWLDHRDDPKFFSYNDTRIRKHDMKKPLLFVGGWYDIFNENVLDGFCRSVADAPSEAVARGHRLIVGHWGHNYSALVRQFSEGESDARLFTMEWMEQQLRGVESEFFRDHPVALFVMGENRWRSEQTWPLQDAVSTKFYIHSDGNANTMLGWGALSQTLPGTEKPDTYRFDPADPVASPGGHSLSYGGQVDQRNVEMRQDVLVYTSKPLEEDMEVTGTVRATLYASTSAADTDFFLKLVDVCPDGTAYNVVTGGRRGRYLKEGRNAPQPLTPGEVLRWDITLRSTSYVFKKGHCLRVDICSSDCMNSDVNPNAFVDLSAAGPEDYVVAEQTVYHDREYPTVIELPVIPNDRPRCWIEPWPFSAGQTDVDFRKTLIPRYAKKPCPPQELDKDMLPE